MGLLTDPSAGQGKVTKALIKYYVILYTLMYVGGVVWFLLLAYKPLNGGTYFSENALLAGLVDAEFRDFHIIRQYHEELLDEMNAYNDGLPYPWLLAKFRQIGLDTYTHNFTLNYPLGEGKTYVGKNIYAIMRAARAGSTESIVLTAPFRPPTNINPTTAPSISVMLAFAKFANRQKYWAKDIIFLITEHEQLGVQAWLEAYHNVVCGQEGVLISGDLKGRAGAIQAAINLEINDVDISRVHIKIEGLNGQLPNLDLFNLAVRMCSNEGVPYMFKNRINKYFRDSYKEWKYMFKTMLSMMTSQATGIPNGNHGLFLRFGIQALTLEGISLTKRSGQATLLNIARILESIFRSLNNLLERFHQSFFFYLLLSSERFISIGLYMPAVCLVIGTLFVKACGLWCGLQKEILDKFEREEKEKHKKCKNLPIRLAPDQPNLKVIEVGLAIVLIHIVGVTIMNSPPYINNVGLHFGYKTDISIYVGFALISLVLLAVPLFFRYKHLYETMVALHTACLLELGTALICISMLNFSLGFLCGVLYAPLVLLIDSTRVGVWSFLQKFLWLLVHPWMLLNLIIFSYTFLTYTSESFGENIERAVVATQQAIMYSVVDSMIYSNWLYNVVTAIFMSNWLCFWIVLFGKPRSKDDLVIAAKKTD